MRYRHLFILSTLVWFPLPAWAQVSGGTANSPDSKSPASSTQTGSSVPLSEDVIELSPFEVNPGDDEGYLAANTTSGTRLKSRLKDTPAAISAFTPEFLSDIAATSLEDMMAYAANVEFETEDATNGFNNPEGRFATSNDYRFRMRGMNAGASRDFVDSAVPVDLFNVERVEVASGPNSILFGLGNAGGNVALSTKRANASRNKTTLSNVIGSWDYERLTADHNQVLIPRKLGVRLLGLYQNSGGWKYWDFSDQKRIGGAVVFRPFKTTAMHLNYESGKTTGSTTVNWNAADQVTAWFAAGRPLADGAAVTGTTRNNANHRYTFVENDNSVYNFRQELVSSRIYSSETLLPAELSPYNYNTVGPAGIRDQEFESRSVIVEQRAGSLDFEFGYFHNRNDVMALSAGGQPVLFGDPNITIPPPSFVGSVRNPRAGQLYFEQSWTRDTVSITNDVFRVTTALERNLGKWLGRHRLAALLEHSETERIRYLKDETWIDQNNAAINNPLNPEGAQNRVYRRHYVTEGDFRTYYMGNGFIPTPTFSIGSNTYHSQYVSRTKANAHAEKAIDSYMLAAQSFWWRNRFITTLGYRLDRIKFRNELESRLTDPGDPRIAAGIRTLNEWDFNGVYEVNRYSPTTFTAGSVLHATDRISAFYNASTNRGTPRFDRTVLPNGDVPPPTEGESSEYGAMLDIFGNEKIFLRLTRFDTKQLRDAPIIPNGVATETSGIIGGNNLRNIYDALLAAGAIDQSRYDNELVFYSAGMVDVETKGYELELVARPTRSINIRFNYSYSDRNRTNIFSEIFDYYATKAPEWLALAAGNALLTKTIQDELVLVEDKLQDQLDVQSGPLGSRPHKFTLTGRYSLDHGRLKGFSIGGALRYQSANIMSYDREENLTERGNEMLFGDVFSSYRRKSPWGRGLMIFQINVTNVTNDYLVGIGRRNADRSGIRRVYLNQPRRVRFTTTFEF